MALKNLERLYAHYVATKQDSRAEEVAARLKLKGKAPLEEKPKEPVKEKKK